MAWPPAYSNAFLAQGVTTIRWGTDGIMTNAAPNGNGSGGFQGFFTLETIRGEDEMDVIYIEQGSGLKATRITLWQGRNYVLTAVDDTNMTPPSPASQLYIVDALGAGGSIYYFRVTKNGYNSSRKSEGKREITCEYLTCIEGGGTPPEI